MKGKVASLRQQKVSTLINNALVECLRRGKMLDHRLIDMPITITRVEVSADLLIANCYFLPFNTKFSEKELIDALNLSKNAIRSFVTKKVQLKYSTELRFFYDDTFNNAVAVEEILKNLIK